MVELKKFKDIYFHLHDGIDANLSDNKASSIVKGRVLLYIAQVALKIAMVILGLTSVATFIPT